MQARGQLMNKLADLMEQHADELAALETLVSPCADHLPSFHSFECRSCQLLDIAGCGGGASAAAAWGLLRPSQSGLQQLVTNVCIFAGQRQAIQGVSHGGYSYVH